MSGREQTEGVGRAAPPKRLMSDRGVLAPKLHRPRDIEYTFADRRANRDDKGPASSAGVSCRKGCGRNVGHVAKLC